MKWRAAVLRDRGMAARFFAFMECDNLEHLLEKPRMQCRMKKHQSAHCGHKSALALISPFVLHSAQARQGFSPISRSKFIEIFVEFRPGFWYNLCVSLCLFAGVKFPC